MRESPTDRGVDELLTFGVVNLDKPSGPSSHQVSAWVRDLAEVEKAAHAGTLDPKVTGCLPVLLGAGTRIAEALLGRKEYVSVLELHDDPPETLGETLTEFIGPIYQRPPRKSAVRRRLRVREIYDLEIYDVVDTSVLIRIACESGTYVRKVCHDLGLALGTGAHMGDLRRTATTPFDDRDLVTLHDFVDALSMYRERGDEQWIREVVQPAERALEHIPRITIAPSAAREVANGAPVFAPGVIESEKTDDTDTLVACYTPNGSVVCLGRLVGDPSAETGKVVDLERVLV